MVHSLAIYDGNCGAVELPVSRLSALKDELVVLPVVPLWGINLYPVERIADGVAHAVGVTHLSS